MPDPSFPRRCNIAKFVPAEMALYAAMQVIESMPADPRLTEAVVLAQKARDCVADFVDGIQPVMIVEAFPRMPPPETGWLIEDTSLVAPRYWSGGPATLTRFTNDSLKAVRFTRQEDAQRVIDRMFEHFKDRLAAREHMWDVTPSIYEEPKA